MPHTVEALRTMEHATQAYILTIDGLPIAFTTDTSGELVGSGASSFIGRAESDLGETVGGREIREGLVVPDTLEFGGRVLDLLGLDRTTAKFSILLDPSTDTADYFAMGGEEPEEMLGRLAPYTDPAPATVVGVTVRDRYLGLERIGPNGERHMYPYLVGETLAGLDHHGDTDGATVPASVSQRPLVHEGRPWALYRVYRDPSSTSVSNSDAWPSLSNYRPIAVGKLRDAGKVEAGGRIDLEGTGFETLLENTKATIGGRVFDINPEFSTTAGVDDQVAIYLAESDSITPALDFNASKTTCQGRLWTTLTGSSGAEIRASLGALLSDTTYGTDTDYAPAAPVFSATNGSEAHVSGNNIYVRRNAYTAGDDYAYSRAIIAMHRRRWLALGFDPHQQDHNAGPGTPMEDERSVVFKHLPQSGDFVPEAAAPSMGAIPGPGYFAAEFTTIPFDRTQSVDDRFFWDNKGGPRVFYPLFGPGQLPRVLNEGGGQVLRIPTDVAMVNQSHVARSGSIDGTDCDAAGFILIRGKIRKAEGETDDASLVIDDEAEQAVIARVSWVVFNDYFPDIGSGVSGGLYVEQLYDPRTFGYPYRPIDRDWAAYKLTGQQIYTWALGTAASPPERADQTLSAFLRSTGTSTGPDGSGVIQQGINTGDSTGFFGDIFTAEMGLGVPEYLCPTQAEITSVMEQIPGGTSGHLIRCRPNFDASFPSYHMLNALMAPRGLMMGFHGARFMVYQLGDVSPGDAHVSITESDLWGELGDPTTVYPAQESRAFAPVDYWEVKDASSGREHKFRALDSGASTRRGDNAATINGRGLIAPELYGDDPTSLPQGGLWKNEAEQLFGRTLAEFFARRHGLIRVRVSRPKGQDLYPGTVVLLSNPWVRASDGSQGVSSVVGRVMRVAHHLKDGGCEAEIVVFEGQWQQPAHFAPALWISRVNNSTTLTISTSPNQPSSEAQKQGWEKPAWATGDGGNLIGSLIRMLPTGAWTVVGTAEVDRISGNTVLLATSLTAMPPSYARTMMLVPDVMSNQPAWAQEIYSAVGVQGDNSGTRRFV